METSTSLSAERPASRSLQAASAEEAFAKAYLELGLSERDKITKKTIEERTSEYVVTIEYTAIQTINF